MQVYLVDSKAQNECSALLQKESSRVYEEFINCLALIVKGSYADQGSAEEPQAGQNAWT